jgi:hypothetical protein
MRYFKKVIIYVTFQPAINPVFGSKFQSGMKFEGGSGEMVFASYLKPQTLTRER